jgi:2-oxoglutarate/2-oxoacid ferredoxin oxidoreductase subunit beta
MATGAVLANPSVRAIGMSGDGDTANIGMGQFKHLVRRNVPMVYIVANNGVYGLTKGQFSATADYGLELKRGERNTQQPVDICHEALAGGATFVARSFAGDPKQLETLIKAALCHRGTAVLDVISPCVTFNNRAESPKSYAFGRQHESPLHEIGFFPADADYRVDYEPGTEQRVRLSDGSEIRLRKIGTEYDPTDRAGAEALLERARREGLYLTGLLYIDGAQPSFVEVCQLEGAVPLAHLTEAQTRPSPEALQALCARFA